MVVAPKYEKNTMCTNPWKPNQSNKKTLNNAGSVAHNIINHQENEYFTGRGSDAASYGRLKGIAEFQDLKHPFASNANHDHVRAIQNDPHVFKRKEGVCSNLYTAAKRFGE